MLLCELLESTEIFVPLVDVAIVAPFVQETKGVEGERTGRVWMLEGASVDGRGTVNIHAYPNRKVSLSCNHSLLV